VVAAVAKVNLAAGVASDGVWLSEFAVVDAQSEPALRKVACKSELLYAANHRIRDVKVLFRVSGNAEWIEKLTGTVSGGAPDWTK